MVEEPEVLLKTANKSIISIPFKILLIFFEVSTMGYLSLGSNRDRASAETSDDCF